MLDSDDLHKLEIQWIQPENQLYHSVSRNHFDIVSRNCADSFHFCSKLMCISEWHVWPKRWAYDSLLLLQHWDAHLHFIKFTWFSQPSINGYVNVCTFECDFFSTDLNGKKKLEKKDALFNSFVNLLILAEKTFWYLECCLWWFFVLLIE